METIIDKLFQLSSKSSQTFGFFDKEATDKECEFFDYLFNNLSPEHKNIFSKYIELRGIRAANELQAAYESGFKTAVRLFIEALKE